MKVIERRLFRILRFRNYSTQTTAAFSNESPGVKPFEKVPGATGKFALPVVGNFLLGKSLGCFPDYDLRKYLTGLQKTYGDIVKIKSTRFKWTVLLFHPDFAKEALEIKLKYPYRPVVDIVAVYSEKKNLGQNLVTLNGEDWAKLRKPTQELILRPVAVATYVGTLSSVADDFVDKYKNGGTIDNLREALSNYASESVGMLCFNRRLGCLDKEPIINIQLLDDVLEVMEQDLKSISGVKLYRFFPTPSYRKFEKGADHVCSICHAEIKVALEKLENAKNEGKLEEYLQQPNLLNSLLSHPEMTQKMVDRTLMDLFFAGVDSTSNALTFLWFELAKNPDKQEKLHQEIMTVCGKNDVTKEALAKMSYLKACVREAMRIYVPTSPGMYRCLDHDVVIGGYHIPAKTEIIPCLQNMCEDPRFFKSPERFLPERFVRNDKSLSDEYKNTNPFATLPFGFGPRSCVGQRFAETEMYVITAKFFQHFEARLPPGTNHNMEYRYRTFATPKHAVSLVIKPRTETK